MTPSNNYNYKWYMSLISTIRCGKHWVRYFVAETEPCFGRPPEDDSSPDWDNLQRLIDSFPGKIAEKEIEDPTIEPTQQALALTRDCPIDMHLLANYLTIYLDEAADECRDILSLTLHRATYTIAPSLLELAALNTQDLGTEAGLNALQILGKDQSKRIKRKTGVTLGKIKFNPADF
jgi:hypothetical protein